MTLTRHTRARQACLLCNARRVKCDVIDHSPCTNCVAADKPCVLRESRRGKHPRRPRQGRAPKKPDGQQSRSVPQEMSEINQPIEITSSPRPTDARLYSATQLPLNGSVSDSTSPAPKCVGCGSCHSQHCQGFDDSNNRLVASQALAELSQNEIPGPFLAFGSLDNNIADRPVTITPRGNVSVNSGDADNVRTVNDEETVFLGESTLIRHIHGTHNSSAMSSSIGDKLVHPAPRVETIRNLTSEWEAKRKESKLRFLDAEGAFSFPPKPAIEILLKAYFKWFHSCFPILDEPDIWDHSRRGILSPLLLQSILFIGVMHCSEDNLSCVGLGSRQQAKCILYNRAKDLFDADTEPKVINVIQALFLMSFWRAGPLLQKDTRHWLGAAVSLAQTKGLHRSSQNADRKTQGLRKRLWWSIYIRERQCAAALGLPNRVRDEDCDVDALNDRDFDSAFGSSTSLLQAQETTSFMVGMVELSRMLGKLIHRDSLPTKHLTHLEREEFKDSLIEWRRALPISMQPSMDWSNNSLGFLASMLHLAYNNLLILLYRSGCGSSIPSSGEIDGKVAIQAATHNSAIIENMVTEGYISHSQIHVITNIFNTLCIHTLNLKSLTGSRRYIVEHRAKLCLLSLRELQKIWEFKNWILQLFFKYLDQSTAERLHLDDEDHDSTFDGSQDHDSGFTGRSRSLVDSHGFEAAAPGAQLHSDTSWSIATQDVGKFLHSQIESRFTSTDNGMVDWYIEDFFDTTIPP